MRIPKYLSFSLSTFSLSTLAYVVPAIAEFEAIEGEFIVELTDKTPTGREKTDLVRSLGDFTGKAYALFKDKSLAEEKSVVGKFEDHKSEFCDELLQQGIAKMCERNLVYKTAADPNDPNFASLQQYNFAAIPGTRAVRAWDVKTGTKSVVVAVMDTGIDYTHPDLLPNMWVNTSELINGIDDDGNGIVDDIHGANFVSGSPLAPGNPADDNAHGTHVAGIIGAKGNNGVGVTGMNWTTSLMAVKVLDAAGNGTTAAALSALDNYIFPMKILRGINIRVVNMSWGSDGHSQALFDKIEYGGNIGIIFVAAAGNQNRKTDDIPYYPASYTVQPPVPTLISVTALDASISSGPRWMDATGGGNYGPLTVDIAAPGFSIFSTLPGNGYGWLSGTSMATPFVSGAAALYLHKNPSATAASVVNKIESSKAALSSMVGITKTVGTLNAGNLLVNY